MHWESTYCVIRNNGYQSFRRLKKHIMNALSKQPVAVGFRMFKELDNYRGGSIKTHTNIYDPKGAEGHAALIVGHGWVRVNNHDEDCGDEGCFKISSDIKFIRIYDDIVIPISDVEEEANHH